MDTVRTLERTRWVRLMLCALGVAVGWTALSFALGTGATASQAADDESKDGLLSSLVGTVEDAAGILPDAVEEPVAEVVERVEKTTKKTVSTVTKTVTKTAAKAVDSVVAAKPVTTVTRAVTKTVEQVPVVGTVAEDLGVTDVVDAVGDTADGILSGVDRTVDTVVDAIVTSPPVEAVSPDETTDPTDPAVTAGGAGTSTSAPASPPTAGAFVDVADTPASASWRAVDATPAVAAAAAASASAAGLGRVDDDQRHPNGVPSPLASPPVSLISSGSAGASTAAGTVPSSLLPHAHNAWLRGVGSDDQNAPPGPPAAPDVAPD